MTCMYPNMTTFQYIKHVTRDNDLAVEGSKHVSGEH